MLRLVHGTISHPRPIRVGVMGAGRYHPLDGLALVEGADGDPTRRPNGKTELARGEDNGGATLNDAVLSGESGDDVRKWVVVSPNP